MTLFRVRRIKDAFVSEINFLQGKSFVSATLNSFHGKYAVAEDVLLKFMAQVTERQEIGESGEGFCLGPIAISGEFKEESANLLFRDSKDKGTIFDVLVNTYQPDPATPLLKRMSGPDSLLAKFDAKHEVLRERELVVGEMQAQEWLGTISLEDGQGKKQYGFAMETMRSTPSKRLPRIRISFDTGQSFEEGSVNPSEMTDEAALQLWGTVLKSIRPSH